MSDRGLSRRTFAGLAALSLPVVSMVASVPALAASRPVKSLSFTPAAVTVDSCSKVSDLTLVVTRDGAAAVDERVTLTLPAGFSWADGTTADKSVLAGPGGAVSVSVVQVALRNGDYPLRAMLDTGETTSATITVTTTETTAEAWFWDSGWTPVGAAAPTRLQVKGAVRAIGYGSFMTADSTVLYFTTEVARSVSSAVAEHTDLGGGRDTITFVAGGAAKTYFNNGTVTAFPAVPPTAIAVGTRTWLTPDGDLYLGETVLARGVTSARGNVYTGGAGAGSGEWVNVTYIQDNVGKVYDQRTSRTSTGPSLRRSATVVGALTFLDSNGDLYNLTDPIASGVESAFGAYNPGTDSRSVSYRKAGAAYAWRSGTTGSTALGAVPDGSTLIGSNAWISPSGQLFWKDHVVATSVVNGTAFYLSARDRDIINFVTSTASC